MKDFDIREELKKLPNCPGVYIMHDCNDRILYVGKAKILKRRVSQYFRPGQKLMPKIRKMVSLVNWFEYIVVGTELESLVLENNLIKEHRPPYNTLLKDDKTYPFIKVTTDEAFPRVVVTRKQLKDKAKYFGPYTNGVAVNDTVDLINKIYHIRTCTRTLPAESGTMRPCLYYQLHQCDAPCIGNISEEQYGKMVEKVLKFLGRDYSDGIAYLEQRMAAASEAMEYEQAAEYRDLITRVKALSQTQRANDSHIEERDIIAMVRENGHCVVQIFFERDGKLIGREHFHMTETGEREPAEIMTEFIKQYYEGTPYIPKEILVEVLPDEQELLAEWLSNKKERPVHFTEPKIGGKERLVELAKDNARMVIRKDLDKITKEEKRTLGAMQALAELLGIDNLHRIESYDISNISGFHSVGSMVVFVDGRAKTQDYRKFRIRSVDGPNDYASMQEVLTRRFTHGLKELEEAKDTGFSRLPDVLLMDGGEGQIGVAEEVLASLGLTIPVCGMVKDDHHRTRGLLFQGREIALSAASRGNESATEEVASLVTRIQDETHRFAIEYHKSLRSKAQVHSALDDIPGIGPTRRRTLMTYYRSMAELREAAQEDLEKLPGMNRAVAQAVYGYLHSENQSETPAEPDAANQSETPAEPGTPNQSETPAEPDATGSEE